MTTDTETFDALAVATGGNYVYLVVREVPSYFETAQFRLAVMDVSDPATIVEVASLEFPEGMSNVSVEVRDSVMVVASARSNVTLLDISEPALPVEVATLDTVADDIAIDGNKIYVGKESDDPGETIRDGLQIFDISDPAAPVKLSETRGTFRGVSAFGDQAFLTETAVCLGYGGQYSTCGTALEEYDVSDPTNPIRRPISKPGFGDGYPIFGGEGTWIGEVVKKKNALLVVANGLYVLDLAKPNRDKAGDYRPEFPPDELGDKFGAVAHATLTNGKVLTVVRHGDSQGIRTLNVSIRRPQAFLPLITR